MGITNRNARSKIGKWSTSINRIAPLKLALGALALLMVSGVLAQSGAGYTLNRWVIAGGGRISSSGGGYTLGSTVGQAGAGRVSGGSFTIYGGFWKPGTVVKGPPSPIYVPIARQSPPPPPPTPACNDTENNDTPQQARPLTTIGTTCIGSLQDDPQSEDDWYSINLAAGQTISIDLTGIPAGADYDLALHNAGGAEVASSTKGNATDEQLAYRSAAAGRYTIRVFMYRKSLIATNTYQLKAVIS
jgi:hypothetical protein